MSSKLEPVIFLLDLDGTLQGDIHPQVLEYELTLKINSVSENKVKYDTKKLFKDMSKGLIRPFVKDALVNIKKKHPNVEFFVYTASSDEWAKFLLPRILHYLFNKNQIINKPFLTRSDCLPTGKKDITKVKPKVVRALRKRYPNASFNNIFLVDNNIVLENNEIDRLILCPSYDYRVLNSPLRNFTQEHLEKYHSFIANEMFDVNTINHIEFFKLYYDNAFKEYVDTEERNKEFVDDRYWNTFRKIVVNGRLDTQKNVSNVIKRLQNIYTNNKYLVIKKVKSIRNSLNEKDLLYFNIDSFVTKE